MVKKKNEEIKPPNIYEEMDFSREEVERTLPMEEPSYEKAIPDQPQKPEEDYLDDFPSPIQPHQKEHSQPLMFSGEEKENLIADLLKVDWERVEHIIRGHKPKVDPKTGDEYFVRIENHYLNDYGVNSILHFLSFYLSKDIKLGRYSAEQVQVIMKNFAKQFTDWFYDNIVEFGLDTPSKKKMSKMFVQSVIDLVDASFSCAIEGKTIELMLKQFTVMQQQPLFEGGYSPQQIPQKPKIGVMQRIFG